MPGIEKLMRGIMRYRKKDQKQMIQQCGKRAFTLIFACMDSRVFFTKFTHSEVGDGYIVRNAGNLVPHASKFDGASTEPGALELGCLVKGIKDIVVCGHSDCKGMQALYDMRDSLDDTTGSPLQLWLKRHGKITIDKFKQLIPENSHKGPLKFQGEMNEFLAYIDDDNQYQMYDKLSQVNCLQQVENIVSYDFMKEKFVNDGVKIHSFWFDIYKGDVHMFSRTKQKFLVVDDDNFDHLLQDTKRELAIRAA